MRNLPEDLSENPSLESIGKLIGADRAALISAEIGGLKLYIPKNPGEHCILAAVVGLEDARAIADIYGGMEFVVPIKMGHRYEAQMMLKEGKKRSDIVRHLRCSRGFVNRIAQDMADDLQIDLFDPPSGAVHST